MKRGISDNGMRRLALQVRGQAKGDGLAELAEAKGLAEDAYRRTRSMEDGFEVAKQHLEEDGNYAYFDVESLPYEETGPLHEVEFYYLNAGDTYADTLCFTPDEGFFISSYGAWVESTEREWEEKTGERLCGYCGAWSEEVAEGQDCPACGHSPEE